MKWNSDVSMDCKKAGIGPECGERSEGLPRRKGENGEQKECGCVKDQPQHSRMADLLRLVEDDTAALQSRIRNRIDNGALVP